jgi:polyisoprenyl-teichoic acid--peptidoglycan teichoic acid transferase
MKAAVLLLALIAGVMLLRPLAWVPDGGPPLRLPAMVERRSATSTFLILGLDRRGGEIARTDTILLARVGPPGQPPAVLSIPRDLWVQIPGRGEDRINTAFVWGELGPGGGPALAKKTVEDDFGIRIDRVAVVDFSCFQAAVDAAGRITIDVPQRLVDETYPTENGGTMRLVFEAGRQTMTGERALQYVRTRSPDSDFGRIRRQQQMLSAITDRLHDPAVGVRVLRAALSRCPDAGTEVSLADIALLGAMSATSGIPRFRVLDESTVSPVTLPSGAQVLQPRWDRIRPLVAELFGGRPIQLA